MYDTPLSTQEVLTRLAEQAKAIGDMTEDIRSSRLRGRPHGDEWSASEVLGHLRACADMWGGYIAKILDEDHPTFKAVNPRTWIESTDYRDLDVHVSFRAFARQRAALLRVLRRLPDESWSRRATVTGAGRPRERTVYDYAQWLVNHERSHLKQLARLAEKSPR